MTTSRGGQRPGAGRRPSVAAFRRDEYLILERQSLGGDPPFHRPELARVLRASRDELELQIGNDILVLRRPDTGEVHLQ